MHVRKRPSTEIVEENVVLPVRFSHHSSFVFVSFFHIQTTVDSDRTYPAVGHHIGLSVHDIKIVKCTRCIMEERKHRDGHHVSRGLV